MILKKCLSVKYSILKGQSVLEYFILFAVIGVLGIVSLSTFFPKIRDTVISERYTLMFIMAG